MELQDIASACVKCGKCIPTCTTYQLHKDEVHSPRGFLESIYQYTQGNLALDASLQDALDTCFLCNHCVSSCPISLPIDGAIEQMRMRAKKSLFKRFYFFLLRHRWCMDWVFRLVAFIPPCAFRGSGSGLLGLRFAKKPFLKRYARYVGQGVVRSRAERSEIGQSGVGQNKAGQSVVGRSSTEGSERGKAGQKARLEQNLKKQRVGIFIGCLGNYNYPSMGESLLEILEILGIEVLLPKQECCGAPAYFGGDLETSLLLVQRNIAHLESIINEVDAILIPEATCAAVMLKDWGEILRLSRAGEEWQARLSRLTPKMSMATPWLYHATALPALLARCGKQDLIFTYHDPCHAAGVLGITQEPRALLGANYRFLPLEDSTRCCGFGGVGIQMGHSALARRAGERKADAILASGASVVSAECSACRVQITASLAKSSTKEKPAFAHPLELIAKALESLPKEA